VAKRGENPWVPNLMNMAGGKISPILNSESVSRYDVSLVMLQTHAIEQQKVVLCSNWWLKLIPKHITVQC
jgi:hypothetical protein